MKIKNFNTFCNENETKNYPPPENVVDPAPGDKIDSFMREEMKKRKSYFEPKIKTSQL